MDKLTNPCCDQYPQESGSKKTLCTEAREGIINWDLLIDRLGDEELIKEIVPIFLNDNKKRLEMLIEALKAEDTETIRFCAHRIKGAAKNVAATQLSDIAYQLECAGEENDLGAAAALLDTLKAELEKVVLFLSQADWIELAKREKVITDEKLEVFIASRR